MHITAPSLKKEMLVQSELGNVQNLIKENDIKTWLVKMENHFYT